MNKKISAQFGDRKIIFMGTSLFARDILADLLSKNVSVGQIITRPDRPAGRKKYLQASPVKKFTASKGLSCAQFEKLDEETYEQLKLLRPDIIIVVAYGMIIPKKILDLPKLGAINVHPSLLPKYRGTSPIQASLLHGDTQTGTTIMVMDEGIDTGPILEQKTVTIDEQDTFSDLEKKIARASNKILLPTIERFARKELKPRIQKNDEASQTSMIRKKDGAIDWNHDAESIYNKYRAYFQWPKVFTFFDDNGKIKKMTIELMTFDKRISNIPPGKVGKMDGKIVIGAKNGVLFPKEITLEGTKKTTVAEFINGRPHFINSILTSSK